MRGASALDDVVHRRNLRLSRVHAYLLENRHQRLPKGVESSLRFPHVEDLELVPGAEAGVIKPPCRLSGTGPKAGGPNYLRRFALEQVVTINTAAAGGNASLLAEEES